MIRRQLQIAPSLTGFVIIKWDVLPYHLVAKITTRSWYGRPSRLVMRRRHLTTESLPPSSGDNSNWIVTAKPRWQFQPIRHRQARWQFQQNRHRQALVIIPTESSPPSPGDNSNGIVTAKLRWQFQPNRHRQAPVTIPTESLPPSYIDLRRSKVLTYVI